MVELNCASRDGYSTESTTDTISMTGISIPFNKAGLRGPEFDYISQALSAGHVSGDGPFTKKCQKILQEQLGVPRALLTTSCTHALEMAALLLRLKPGDEFIVPSFTFVSTANAFVLRGAKPVFADIRSDTLNLDETKLEGHITPRTRAIVPVHYAGVGCEMDPILSLAHHHGIVVVEDNAHGLYGKYRGRFLGTFGVLATLSFHETKNITCGEGGALLVNDPQLIERAEIIWEKGTNRSRFFRGQVDKYTWVDIGSSYVLSDILSAFLFAQLESASIIQQRRQEIWTYYHTHLKSWADRNQVRLPRVPEHCQQAYHMFYLLFPDLDTRQAMIRHLKEQGILSVFHYLPLHLSDMGHQFGGQPGDCPVTEWVSDRLLRLPFFNPLTWEEQERVVAAMMNFNP